jgi:hypothetical protein
VLTSRDVDARTGAITVSRYYVRKAPDATGKIIKAPPASRILTASPSTWT